MEPQEPEANDPVCLHIGRDDKMHSRQGGYIHRRYRTAKQARSDGDVGFLDRTGKAADEMKQ